MRTTTAAEVMTRGVLTVDADWSVGELATFLEHHAISGAPVVDAEGALLGAVSVTDIARRDGSSKVREIMTPMIFSVDTSASAQEVADTMIRGRVHRLFVMEGGRLVGVISSLDLLSLVRGV